MPRDDYHAPTDTLHAELLEALIEGVPGIRSHELHELYDAVAPIAYLGKGTVPLKSRCHRRTILDELAAEGRIVAYETSTVSRRVWIPGDSEAD